MYGYIFGREVEWRGDDGWFYVDSGMAADGPIAHDCPHCEERPTDEGHDPCITNLPGVEYACCGHGVTRGYVKFTNGLVLRGYFDHIDYEAA